MAKDTVTCGIRELKKNQKRGTMIECAKKGQIRYWGLFKVDNNVAKLSLQNNKTKTSKKNSKKPVGPRKIEPPKSKYTIREAEVSMAGMHSRANKLRDVISGNGKPEVKLAAKQELAELQKKFDIVHAIYKKLKSEKDAADKKTKKGKK